MKSWGEKLAHDKNSGFLSEGEEASGGRGAHIQRHAHRVLQGEQEAMEAKGDFFSLKRNDQKCQTLQRDLVRTKHFPLGWK